MKHCKISKIISHVQIRNRHRHRTRRPNMTEAQKSRRIMEANGYTFTGWKPMDAEQMASNTHVMIFEKLC